MRKSSIQANIECTDKDMVRMIISEFKANINSRDINGRTPLHYACKEGHLNIISEFQANADGTDNIGQTPLHYACKKGHKDVARVLISEFQASVECTDIILYEQTPLHHACAKKSLEENPDFLQYQDRAHCTVHFPAPILNR